MKKIILGFAALAAAHTADAATIKLGGTFFASNWDVSSGTPDPFEESYDISHSVTFDYYQTYVNDTSVFNSISGAPYSVGFSYKPGQSFYVLATNGTPTSCNMSANSFCAIFDLTGGIPPVAVEAYVDHGTGGVFSAGNILNIPKKPPTDDIPTFPVTPPGTTPAVPEPATWAMLIAGFGLVGSAMRRRRPALELQSAAV